MTRVWFICAAHGRPGLTRLVFEQWARLFDELALTGINAQAVVAADSANARAARELGLVALNRPNRPLGRKVNDAIEYACREGEADHVVTIGSDDWCLPDLFHALPDERTIKTGGYAAIVHPGGERICLIECANGVGALPWIIPRQLLDPVGFRPVQEHINLGIDGSIRRALLVRLPNGERPNARRRQLGLQTAAPFWPVACDPLQLVDFKTDVNLTPYEQVAGRRPAREEPNPFGLLATRYPADLVERMEALYLTRETAAA